MFTLRFLFLFSICTFSYPLFSQQKVEIGDDKKMVAVLESGAQLLIAYQDLVSKEKEDPSYFITDGQTQSGPFNEIEKKDFVDNTVQFSYFVVSKKGKKYVLINELEIGPFESPQLIKKTPNRVLIADFSKKGMYYEIFSTSGGKIKSLEKSKTYTDNLNGIHVSDNFEVLLAFDSQDENTRHYFIYDEQKTGGFYHAVHFNGWLRTEEDGFEPVFTCVAPIEHEMYDVTNDLYVGNRLIEKIVAILYDFSFNSDHTDFSVKGYTADRDGAHIYSSNSSLGPFDAVLNLKYDSNDKVTFDYEENGQAFKYENGQGGNPIVKQEYDWKNVAPNGTDYLMGVSNPDLDIDEYYFNEKLILQGQMWNINFVTWTENHGPILIEEMTKPASPNPDPGGETWHGEVPNGYRLIIDGEPTKIYQSILDFKESSLGEIAYIAYENDGFYIFRGDKIKYGPYATFYTIGKEPEDFLQWNGNDLIYSAISDGESHVFVNGGERQSYQSLISFYWNRSLESSATVQIMDMKCFLESDFYSYPLDARPYGEDMEEQFESDLEKLRGEITSSSSCSWLHFNGKKYKGLSFIRDVRFSEYGNVLAFRNMDDLQVIYRDELLNGTLINNRLVFYKDGQLTILNLQKN